MFATDLLFQALHHDIPEGLISQSFGCVELDQLLQIRVDLAANLTFEAEFLRNQRGIHEVKILHLQALDDVANYILLVAPLLMGHPFPRLVGSACLSGMWRRDTALTLFALSVHGWFEAHLGGVLFISFNGHIQNILALGKLVLSALIETMCSCWLWRI